jgi:hypothetical protein
MKITLEQIATYLPHKVGYINTATNKTGIVNTTNLHLFFMNDDLKLLLKPLGGLIITDHDFSENYASGASNYKNGERQEGIDFYNDVDHIISGNWDDYQILLSQHYDFNSLIEQGVAVAINTTL